MDPAVAMLKYGLIYGTLGYYSMKERKKERKKETKKETKKQRKSHYFLHWVPKVTLG